MPEPVPNKLYRYTSIRDHTERIFLNRELYFSEPAAFNDPFDCRVNYSTECTEPTFRELAGSKDSWLARVIRTLYPKLAFQHAVSRAYENRDALVGENARNALDAHIAKTGISCFTELKDNILMWSHYAAQHKGICLEFSTEKSPLFEGVRPIIYTKDCPVYECYSNDLSIIAQRALFRKATDWAYEKEWRLLWRQAKVSRVLTPGTLSAVILGARISETHAAQVKSWCVTLQPRPEIWRAALKYDSYALTFQSELLPL